MNSILQTSNKGTIFSITNHRFYEGKYKTKEGGGLFATYLFVCFKRNKLWSLSLPQRGANGSRPH